MVEVQYESDMQQLCFLKFCETQIPKKVWTLGFFSLFVLQASHS